MKFQLAAFIALVAFATVNSYPTLVKGSLKEDIQYFTDMIPMKKIIPIVIRYAAEDAEFQELLEYARTDDFKETVKEIQTIPEFHTFVNYLEKNGVDVVKALNRMNRIIGVPAFQPMDLYKRTGGLRGLFEEVKALVSYDEIIHGYVYKMRTSEAFVDFVAHLKSPEHQKFVDTLYSNERFLKYRGMLAAKGFDVALVEDIIYTVLGIEFPWIKVNTPALYANPALGKDIRDFIELVDMQKIMKIVIDYMDDDQVVQTFEYIQSEEFHVLVRNVEAMKEYQGLVLYLEDAGLDMFDFLQRVHQLFGMEDYVPPKPNVAFYIEGVFVNKGGLQSLVDDIIAALPLDKFKALYHEKMANSPAFKTFIEKLRSQELQEIINTVYASPIFLEMRAKAIAAGLDLEPFRKLIKVVLGFEFPRVPSVY
ncbi:PREDICTED: uncharacterized protein LOC107192545 [Dufourea novaeangliae]|nr:PREDICTED: uncharacterized protein LOC107192545 [Dufourea novaeangliae]